jgi:hypothetical protein
MLSAALPEGFLNPFSATGCNLCLRRTRAQAELPDRGAVANRTVWADNGAITDITKVSNCFADRKERIDTASAVEAHHGSSYEQNERAD